MSTVTMTNFRCRKCNRRCVNRPDDYPEGLCYWCAMLERAKGRGWKYVDDRSCPRLLVGKRCRNYANANSWGSCWCRTYANDHGYRWKDCEGNKFVLWEPYQVYMDEMVDLLAAARDDGLHVTISHWGIWVPGIVGLQFVPAGTRLQVPAHQHLAKVTP